MQPGDSVTKDSDFQTLSASGGRELAYRFIDGRAPGIAFFGGFRSDMSGTKAMALQAWCSSNARRFLRLDYSGHGRSGGRFEDGCIGDWLDDARTVLNHVQSSPWVFVGSSMGAWIALLLARQQPVDCRALVTLAAATDFTERLLWARLDSRQRQRLFDNGSLPIWSEYEQGLYKIRRHLIEEGRNHLLLDGPIPLTCPVRLIHGLADPDVPWRFSLDTADCLQSPDVRITLLKNGDHRLSEPADLQVLFSTLDELLEMPD